MPESTSLEAVELQPDVRRLVEGFRDTGYEFNDAIADIVDNSIAAGATKIDIRLGVNFDGDFEISIVDNGSGMDRAALENALRYGSQMRSNRASLGKFGLGLKTATTAFCRQLVVVSRNDESQIALQGILDLDRVNETGKLDYLIGSAEFEQVDLLDLTTDGSGTIVLWKKIDRLIKSYQRDANRKKAIQKLVQELDSHLSMVFQKFIYTEESNLSPVAISINDAPVEAWDPFCQSLGSKLIDKAETFSVENPEDGSVIGSIRLRMFVIPRKNAIPAAQEPMVRRFNNNQGVYVFRENRMIYGPNWLRMFSQEPHTSLARVELSFDYQLDDFLRVDIKKSQILIDYAIFDAIESRLGLVRREAEREYREGKTRDTKARTTGLHDPSSSAIDSKANQLQTATIENVDPATGKVSLSNNQGSSVQTIRIVTRSSEGGLRFEAAESLEDGVLWEPSFINGSKAVSLNISHTFYRKVYLANINNRYVIEALDFMLWSLAQAENNNLSELNGTAFQDFRVETSRNLRRLVEDLPEPKDASEVESDENS